MKDNSNRKTLIMSIIAVALIAALVSGGTYAYWTWVSNTDQKTNVSFSVTNNMDDLMYARLDGNGTTTVTNIKPAPCTDSTFLLLMVFQFSQGSHLTGLLALSLALTEGLGLSLPKRGLPVTLPS